MHPENLRKLKTGLQMMKLAHLITKVDNPAVAKLDECLAEFDKPEIDDVELLKKLKELTKLMRIEILKDSINLN
jgi:hypothetical protein